MFIRKQNLEEVNFKNISLDQVQSGIIGLAIGDALGVPVEFLPRNVLEKNPVKSMLGYGTHKQKPGTWSDDTSLTLCLMISLINGIDYYDIAENFKNWRYIAKYTARNEVFDCGATVSQGIANYIRGKNPIECGPNDYYSNGNGSLMRILPLAYYLFEYGDEKYKIIENVSALTHGHIISKMSCAIYINLVINLLKNINKVQAVNKAISETLEYYKNEDLACFNRIRSESFSSVNRDEISSSGYVVHTLEASIWCLLNYNSYDETVLAAVNLGLDTDTTAAVVGGLAGIYYGFKNINQKWIRSLAKKAEIKEYCVAFYNSL